MVSSYELNYCMPNLTSVLKNVAILEFAKIYQNGNEKIIPFYRTKTLHGYNLVLP